MPYISRRIVECKLNKHIEWKLVGQRLKEHPDGSCVEAVPLVGFQFFSIVSPFVHSISWISNDILQVLHSFRSYLDPLLGIQYYLEQVPHSWVSYTIWSRYSTPGYPMSLEEQVLNLFLLSFTTWSYTPILLGILYYMGHVLHPLDSILPGAGALLLGILDYLEQVLRSRIS